MLCRETGICDWKIWTWDNIHGPQGLNNDDPYIHLIYGEYYQEKRSAKFAKSTGF